MSHASTVTSAFQTMFNEVQDRYGIEAMGDTERNFDEFISSIEDELYSSENLGELAYNAWAAKASQQGRSWSQLTRETQDGWIAAAVAVKEDVS